MTNNLADIINLLDDAIVDSDWKEVQNALDDLHIFHEEIQSIDPFEYQEMYGDTDT